MPEMIETMFKLKGDELEELAQIAHKAKSMASYLGCTNLRAMMIEIEHLAENNEDSEIIKKHITEASALLKEILNKLKKVEIE